MPNDNYDELFQTGGNTGLNIGAGVVRGALSQVLPMLDRYQRLKDAENLQSWKQTTKQIMSRLDEIHQYEQLAKKQGGQDVKLFDPQNNPDHEAILRFITDRKPLTDKQYRAFMDIQTPLENLFGDDQPQGDRAEEPSLSSGAGMKLSAPQDTPVGGGSDPTAGNMYGDAVASQPGGRLDAVVPPAHDAPITLPGGQLAEAPTTPGEVLVPPNGGQPVQGDLLSTMRQNRTERQGQFQSPAPGVPDREEGLTLFQRMHNRGVNLKIKGLGIYPGKGFKERTSDRADSVLSKYAKGVPWSEAIEGAGAETLKLARPIAEQILRADLAKRNMDPQAIEQAVASEFGQMSKIDEYAAKADIQQRARLRYAEPIAGAAERGRRGARLDTPIDEKERDVAQARSLFPDNPTAQNAYIQGRVESRKEGEAYAGEAGRRNAALDNPRTREEIAVSDAAGRGKFSSQGVASVEGQAQAKKEGIIERAKIARAERRPVDPDQRRTWFAKDTGENPPALTPQGVLEGKIKKGKQSDRYLKLSNEQANLVYSSKRMMRQFYKLRDKLDKFFGSDAPLLNYIEGNAKEWGDMKRDINAFIAQIGDVAHTYGGEGRRLTEQDREVFKETLGINSNWINKEKLMQVYDDLEQKLGNDIQDLGLQPSAVGITRSVTRTNKPTSDRFVVTPAE